MRVNRGFSLVELMVALVLGLLVIAGAIQLFLMTKRVFSEMEGFSSRQEAVRFVSDILSFDIRTSSFMAINPVDDDGELESFNCNSDSPSLVPDVVSMIYLTYSNGREGSPYCLSDQRLKNVKYFSTTDGDGGAELSMCHTCIDESDGSEIPHDVVLIQDGVSVSFGFLDSSVVAPASGASNTITDAVSMYMTFDRDGGFGFEDSSEEDRSFWFHAVSRPAVVSFMQQ